MFFWGEFLHDTHSRRVNGEGHGIHRKCTNARDRKPAPEDPEAVCSVALAHTVYIVLIAGTGQVVCLQAVLHDIEGDVPEPGQGASQPASQEKGAHIRLWQQALQRLLNVSPATKLGRIHGDPSRQV